MVFPLCPSIPHSSQKQTQPRVGWGSGANSIESYHDFGGKAVNDLAHALTTLREARQHQGNPLEAIGNRSNPLLGVNYIGSRLENSMSQLSTSIINSWARTQTITWQSSRFVEPFQKDPSWLPSKEGFTRSQIKEISEFDSLINTRDRQPYFISPSIFLPSTILATLPQFQTITSYFAQNAIGAGVTAPIRSLLPLEMPTLPAPPNHQPPSIRVLMASETQRSPPESATASTASPINVQGGIHVHITTESIDREHTTETSHLIASQVLKELDRIAQQNRFRRGLPASPFL